MGGDEEGELFVTTRNRLARHRLHRFRPNVVVEHSATELCLHPAAWVGPFYVAADGADRHFVVPGGRVFSLLANAKPGSALTLTRQGDPILALVYDSDAVKSFAFTRSHYFHVTAKPDPKPHGLKAFPGATAEEALDTVAACGRVIRGTK